MHLIRKQTYKLKLSKKWKIYSIFHVLLLKQDTIKKKRADKNAAQLEFEAGNNKKYKVEGIQNSTVYVIESEAGHLSGLYYLVSWKNYLEKESMWKPTLAVQHFWKLFNKFY